MNKQLWFLVIVTPIWFVMHMVIQGGGTGLEAYDTHLLLILFFILAIELFKSRQARAIGRLQGIPVPSDVPTAYSSPAGYVYVFKTKGNNLYKIGKTTNPDVRESDIGVKLPFPITRVHLIPCVNRHTAESILHRRFHTQRVRGEWFRLSEQQVNEIKSIREL